MLANMSIAVCTRWSNKLFPVNHFCQKTKRYDVDMGLEKGHSADRYRECGGFNMEEYELSPEAHPRDMVETHVSSTW